MNFQFSLWRGKVWVQHSCGDTTFWCVVAPQTRWSPCTYSKRQITAKANKDVKDKYQESFRDYLSAADSVESWKSQPYCSKEPWMSFDEPAYQQRRPGLTSPGFPPSPHRQRWASSMWRDMDKGDETTPEVSFVDNQTSHVFLYDRAQWQVPSLQHVLRYGEGLLILMQPEPTPREILQLYRRLPVFVSLMRGKGADASLRPGCGPASALQSRDIWGPGCGPIFFLQSRDILHWSF